MTGGRLRNHNQADLHQLYEQLQQDGCANLAVIGTPLQPKASALLQMLSTLPIKKLKRGRAALGWVNERWGAQVLEVGDGWAAPGVRPETCQALQQLYGEVHDLAKAALLSLASDACGGLAATTQQLQQLLEPVPRSATQEQQPPRHASVLRIIRCPPAASAGHSGGARAGPAAGGAAGGSLQMHVDRGLLTVIADTAPGLQVLSRDGCWMPVPPAAQGQVTVLVGHSLSFLTAGQLPAAVHRVVPAAAGAGRVSLVLQLRPAPVAVLDPAATTGIMPLLLAPRYQQRRPALQLMDEFQARQCNSSGRAAAVEAAQAPAEQAQAAVLEAAEPGAESLAAEQPATAAIMQFTVVILVGKAPARTQLLEVCSSDSVMQLKQLLEVTSGVAAGRQQLLLAGRELADKQSLADAGVRPGAKLHLLLQQQQHGSSSGKSSHAWALPPAAAAAGTPIALAVKVSAGVTCQLRVSSADRVAQVKREVEVWTGCEVHRQRLLLAGLELPDSATLAELRIPDGQQLRLLVKRQPGSSSSSSNRRRHSSCSSSLVGVGRPSGKQARKAAPSKGKAAAAGEMMLVSVVILAGKAPARTQLLEVCSSGSVLQLKQLLAAAASSGIIAAAGDQQLLLAGRELANEQSLADAGVRAGDRLCMVQKAAAASDDDDRVNISSAAATKDSARGRAAVATAAMAAKKPAPFGRPAAAAVDDAAAAADDDSISISVSTLLGGEPHLLQVRSTDSVLRVKQQLQPWCGAAPCYQTLLLAGGQKLAEDRATLFECGIRDGEQLQLVLALKRWRSQPAGEGASAVTAGGGDWQLGAAASMAADAEKERSVNLIVHSRLRGKPQVAVWQVTAAQARTWGGFKQLLQAEDAALAPAGKQLELLVAGRAVKDDEPLPVGCGARRGSWESVTVSVRGQVD